MVSEKMLNRESTESGLEVAEADRRAAYFEESVRPHGQKIKGFDAASAGMFYSLFYTYDVAAGYLSRQLARYSLSLSAFNVLLILSRSENQSCQLTELSQLLIVSRANVTGLIDCLEERSLVVRESGKGDRRSKLARLTPEGQKLLTEILPNHYQKLKRISQGLNRDEKALLTSLLSKLRSGITAASLEQEKI